MVSPFVYLPGVRLSEAELSAASLDGHVVPLGEGYVPADIVETAALRAATLARMLGTVLAASHLTAAWIHGGIDGPPARHTVQRAVPRRLHHIIDRRLWYRDPFVPPEDLDGIGGVRVTSIGRTAADLARTPGDAHAAALRTWARRDPAVVPAAGAWLAVHPHTPHGRSACRLLRELGERSQEDVTR